MLSIFNNNLQSLITTVETMLVETPAYPTSVNADALAEAAGNLGLDISNGITYEIYKDLMNDPYNDEYDKQLIINAWQTYHADVDGSLAGEYYTELLELNQDFNNIVDFWHNTVVRHMNSNIEFDINTPEISLPEIESEEQTMINQLILYKRELDDIRGDLRNIMIKTGNPSDPANIAYDQLSSQYKALDNAYSIVLRKGNVMCEIADVVNKKVNMNGYAVEAMDRFLKMTPQNTCGGNLVDALEALLKGSVGPDFLSTLKRLRVIMKYQIDAEIQSVTTEKQKNDSVFGNRIKQVAQDVCRKDISIKVGVCHKLLREVESVPDSLANSMKPIANKLLSGLREAERAYGNDIVQLYGAHTKSAEAFTRRAISVQEKNVTRDFYNILSIMIDYIENGGDSPGSGTLREWVINLLNNAGLNKIYDDSVGDIIQLDLQ
jgi:hypothetical protein